MKEELRYLSEYISKDIFQVLKVNLTKDTFMELAPKETPEILGFSGYVKNYMEQGGVHYDDREIVKENTDSGFLKELFLNPEAKWSLRFRRKAKDGEYRWTIARMLRYKPSKEEDLVLLLYMRDDHVRDQQGLNSDMKRQYQLLGSLADIYYTMHIIRPKSDSIYEIRTAPNVERFISSNEHASESIRQSFANLVVSSQTERAIAFTDIKTLSERMQGKKMISAEFIGKHMGWFRVQFIVVSYDAEGEIEELISTTQIVEEEKRREEMLRKLSTTDEMTRLFNRRAYEEDMTQYKETEDREDLCYISVDLNSLKEVNDSRGHDAGDEIIIGAANCLKAAVRERGRVYRIGGDEFAVVMHLTKEQLTEVLNELMLQVASWRGEMSKELTLSMGYAFWGEHPTMTFKELANFADQMMYKDKAEYYARTGRNRRNR